MVRNKVYKTHIRLVK